MRYTSAVVLSTLAVGQAAAANAHNRHASFHARREAAKRGDNAVNWDAVAYDLKDVKWDKVNWSSVFASTPAAKPTPTSEEKKPAAVTPTPEPKKEVPAPSSTKAAEASKPSESASKPSSATDKISDVVDDVMVGVAAIADKLNFKVGTNSYSDNGGIWLGKDGKFGMDVTNKGSDDAVWYCWVSPPGTYTAAFVSKSTPDISASVPAGKTIHLNFPDNKPTACSPAKADLPNPYGMVMNTWAEAHFGGGYPTFDVSRNPNMKGSVITMQGSKCKSDFSNCVFQCVDKSVSSCSDAGSYDLINCSPSNGGHGGFDPNMGGMGGGCSMSTSSERLNVSFT